MNRARLLATAQRAAITLAFGTFALSGCSDEIAPSTVNGPIKLDTFCSMAGLEPAKRHTVVVVDTSTIVKARPEEFRQKNPALFALATGLADPEQAVESGAIAARERVTILAGRADAATLSPVFTGCVPGISSGELAARAAAGADGAVDKYFGSDIASEVNEAREEFRRQLLVSLMSLEKQASGPASGDGAIATSPLVRLLKALGQPPADESGVRRLFLFTDVAASLPTGLGDAASARAAGFKAAEDSALRLGMVETHLVPARGQPSDVEQGYLTTFLLGAQGDLKRTGAFTPNGLPPAPVSIASYRGELPVGGGITLPLNLRLATAASGELVNSWISYTGSIGQRATPLVGRFECSGERVCQLKSDPAGGLGQLWRTTAGTSPEPLPGGPFGGLRFIEATETPRSLKGRIFDPAIYLAPTGDMKFEVKRDA